MLRSLFSRVMRRCVKPGQSKMFGRRPAFLRIEWLEDRLVPSTLTVLNNADSGPGSLRAAIGAAVNGDTIVFSNHLRGQTITLASGELAINNNLSIVGLGADQLTISGNAASRVFAITSGTTVSISKLSLTNGLADQGGAIDNAGTLTLSQSSVSGNQAVSDASAPGIGGGILNEAGATLTVTHSV